MFMRKEVLYLLYFQCFSLLISNVLSHQILKRLPVERPLDICIHTNEKSCIMYLGREIYIVIIESGISELQFQIFVI